MASVKIVVAQVSAAGVSPLAPHDTLFQDQAEDNVVLAASELSWIILRPGLAAPLPPLTGLRFFAAWRHSRSCSCSQAARHFFKPSTSTMSPTRSSRPRKGAFRPGQVTISWRTTRIPFGKSRVGFPVLARPPAVAVRTAAPDRFAGARHRRHLESLGWRNSPLRTTVLLQLELGIAGDPSAWREARGRNLSGLRDTLRRYPSTIQERWFGRLWLLKPLVIATSSAFWLASGMIGAWQAEAATRILTSKASGSSRENSRRRRKSPRYRSCFRLRPCHAQGCRAWNDRRDGPLSPLRQPCSRLYYGFIDWVPS